MTLKPPKQEYKGLLMATMLKQYTNTISSEEVDNNRKNSKTSKENTTTIREYLNNKTSRKKVKKIQQN